MQRILNTKKRFLFAWLLHLSHELKVHCRPNQSQSSTYMQAHKMEVKLTAGVVVRMIDKGQRVAQPVQNYV